MLLYVTVCMLYYCMYVVVAKKAISWSPEGGENMISWSPEGGENMISFLIQQGLMQLNQYNPNIIQTCIFFMESFLTKGRNVMARFLSSSSSKKPQMDEMRGKILPAATGLIFPRMNVAINGKDSISSQSIFNKLYDVFSGDVVHGLSFPR